MLLIVMAIGMTAVGCFDGDGCSNGNSCYYAPESASYWGGGTRDVCNSSYNCAVASANYTASCDCP